MTRKDYILIAAALKVAAVERADYPNDYLSMREGWRRTALRLADAFARDNPRFDRERFLKACGVQS